MRKLGHTTIYFCVWFLLASCGGGGGGGGTASRSETVPSETIPVVEPTIDQNIHFESIGDIELEIGEQYANGVVRCCGSYNQSEIILESSNERVATVDQSGVVQAVGVGIATIIATKEGNDQLKDGRAAYQVSVYETVLLNAEVGRSQSIISMEGNDSLYEISRARNGDCDFLNIDFCDHGRVDLWQGVVFEDLVTSLDSPGFFSLSLDGINYGSNWVHAKSMEGRSFFQMVEYQERLWVIGGNTGWFNKATDIWSSSDGKHWVREARISAFPARTGHRVVSFKGQLFLIGGRSSEGFLNDIWSSSDGVNWHQENREAFFSARSGHDVISFQNKLWLVGGENGGTLNDVWSSEDGVNWTLEVSEAAFSPRAFHQVASYQGRMWLFGGKRELNDTWSSIDGVNWEYHGEWPLDWTGPANMRGRGYHQVSVFNDKLWLVSGSGRRFYNDVWVSEDGINWGIVTNSAPFKPRQGHQLAVFNDQLFLVGGSSGRADPRELSLDEVWSSSDGEVWRELVVKPQFPFGGDKMLAEFDGVLHGYVSQEKNDDGFKSIDIKLLTTQNGINWFSGGNVLSCTQISSFTGELVRFRDKVWWSGGNCAPTGETFYSNILYSEDGRSWSRVVLPNAFPSSVQHQIIHFQDQLWVIGGKTSDGPSLINDEWINAPSYTNDIWSSLDGLHWELRAEEPGFPDMAGSQILEFNGRLWLIGGHVRNARKVGNTIHISPKYYNALWSSEDGVHWESHEEKAGFGARTGHHVVEFNGRLWLIGGYAGETKGDIWVSDDGLNWSQFLNSDEFGFGYIAEVYVSGNSLYLVERDGSIWKTEDVTNWNKLIETKWRIN